MYSSFLSFIFVIDEEIDNIEICSFLSKANDYLSQSFTDHEIIIVDNGSRTELGRSNLSELVRNHTYMVSLAKRVTYDMATLAGLDRANGDYAVLFDSNLIDHLDLIVEMFRVSQTGSDIVLLSDSRDMRSKSLLRDAFFVLMRRAVDSRLSSRHRKEALISRRALNWILRYRNQTMFLGELLVSSGYPHKVVTVNIETSSPARDSKDQKSLAWYIITQRTQLPFQFVGIAMTVLFGGILALLTNALMVRIFEMDLLGRTETAEPGWTYLVILLGIGFLFTNLSILIVMRMIYVVSANIRNEPNYIVEKFDRV
ncbi:MAG: glycosyltransferase [Alphaproteobacteria bacterium]|nr:glycosyltransferase [Alphaproteobacteria bacterium]